MTLAAKKRNLNLEARNEIYAKLLEFINADDRFGVDRLSGFVSSTGWLHYRHPQSIQNSHRSITRLS
jgi:hypothetical protein